MRVVCFGDSLTSCGGSTGTFPDILQDRFPDHEFLNKGVGGETLLDARKRYKEDVIELCPDVVLLEYGANDWWKDERPFEEWGNDLEFLIEAFIEAGIKVVVLGVFGKHLNLKGEWVEKVWGADDRSRAYRKLEKAIAEKHGCAYVPNIQMYTMGRRNQWDDRNHINEYGNRHVADTIEPILEDLLRCQAKPIRKPNLKTTRDFWQEAVQLAPDKMAVIDGDSRLTYSQADEQVRAIAAGLAAAGCEPRTRVAVYMPNCLEFYLIYWAAIRLNVMIVPLNTWLRAEGVAKILDSTKPQVLVTGKATDKQVFKALETVNIPQIYTRKPCDDYPSIADLMSDPDDAPLPEIDEDDISIIMHTSGTTGMPKGAIMRHVDLIFNNMAMINGHKYRPDDIHLVSNPMFHCTALYSQIPTAVYQKACSVLTSETNATRLLKLIEKEHITTFLSNPSIFQRIVSLPDPTEFDTSSLRLIGYAGSIMPVSTIRRLQLYFPEVDLRNFFGLTETTSLTHVLKGDEAEERPDSIGRLIPFVDAIIVTKTNKIAAPNEVGELLFARENVIPGYYNAPERIKKAICRINGRTWWRTGDLASVDEEGYFFIKGRAKDMIIVGGENVFAAEVEAILMANDLIKEAAIKGMPAIGVRKALGEMIRAYIVPRDRGLTEEDVRRYCHAHLASFKIPHEIVFVEGLPRNPAGKVIKDKLP